MDRISLFLRELGRRLTIPHREDLFLHQISRLDRDYELEKKWNTFNSKLDLEFQGDLEKYDKAWNRYCTDLVKYYTKNQVVPKTLHILEDQKLRETEFNGDLLPGHIYLKLDLVHAFSQTLEYYKIVPDSEPEIVKMYTSSSLIAESKVARVLAYTLINTNSMHVLVEQLLRTALEDQDSLLARQLRIMGIPIVRKDLDDFVYDITGFEDTFYPFVGQQVLNGVNIHISIFKHDSLIYYYDYALRLTQVQTDFETGRKVFGTVGTREFLPQFVCLDTGEPIREKDLWWEDSDGLHKHDKPIRQVLLGPENVVE